MKTDPEGEGLLGFGVQYTQGGSKGPTLWGKRMQAEAPGASPTLGAVLPEHTQQTESPPVPMHAAALPHTGPRHAHGAVDSICIKGPCLKVALTWYCASLCSALRRKLNTHFTQLVS